MLQHRSNSMGTAGWCPSKDDFEGLNYSPSLAHFMEELCGACRGPAAHSAWITPTEAMGTE